MQHAKRRKRLSGGKIALIVIASIMLAVLIFMSGTWIAEYTFRMENLEFAKTFEKVEKTDTLVPVKEQDGSWTFTTDREFKVLQLTDIHLGGGWLTKDKDQMALNAVAAMITAEKPDLVVVTGDMVYPVIIQGTGINNKDTSKVFATLLDSLGVYWTVVFGNHDNECVSLYDRKTIAEVYSSRNWNYSLFEYEDGDVFGESNHVIKVKNSKGIVTQALFGMDSNTYPGDHIFDTLKALFESEYDTFHTDQVAWYEEQVKSIHSYNQSIDPHCKMFKSLLFCHIPLIEQRIAYQEYVNAGNKDTANVKWLYGTAGEVGVIVHSSNMNTGLFDKMLELGSTQGVFFGHDHLNNFALNYKGINLEYAMSVDYLGYPFIDKVGSQRGCKVITINPDGTYTSTNENYYQDKYVSRNPKEQVSMEPYYSKYKDQNNNN